MKRVRFPEDQASLCVWLKREKKRGEEPSKIWREWWTLNNAIQRPGVEKFLPQPFVAKHVDERVNGADFELTFADKTVLALEITEATTKEDRREIVRSRKASEAMSFGSQGGRFGGGVKGEVYEHAMVCDINDSIQRKSKNRYGRRSCLLIYPNSNAGFAEMRVVAQRILPLTLESPFDFALVVREHSLIAITKEMVTLMPKTESSIR